MYSGGTKQGELDRSAELFTQILKEQGAYFALMFLLDSGYGREEIAAIANRLKKGAPCLSLNVTIEKEEEEGESENE